MGKSKNIQIRKAKCLWCLKKYNQKSRIIKKGFLKGERVVEAYCSKRCGKLMGKYLDTLNLLEDLEEIRLKMRKGKMSN